MPRCPNGSRRNKSTGVCDKNISRRNKSTRVYKKNKKEILMNKLQKCIAEADKMKRKNPNILMSVGPDLLKYGKLIIKCRDLQYEIDNLDESKHLNEEDISSILHPYADNSQYPDIKDMMINKLKKITYDKKYKNCFGGEKSLNLYYQAKDKVDCFFKYGTGF